MLKFLKWLDNNILAVLAGFLIVFIPLYPKWPLFDILYGYNVRVRVEDFFVAFTLAIFCIQLLRRKIQIHRDLPSLGLITYLVIGLASSLFAIFILKTVPLTYMQAGKTMLHWLRRVEYFSLFFIIFGAIKTLRQIKIYTTLFFITLGAVIVYGFGQKYLYWPAFSTMNREFAKGWWLYLTEHARVLSTFGGHYDLAAYLVIALTLAWAFFFGLKKNIYKFLVGLLIAGGFWLLVLTASRVSFVSYLIGLTVVVFFWSFKKTIEWGISRYLVAVGLSILIMVSFGDLSDRFSRIFRFSERFSGLSEILLKPSVSAPKNNAAFLENNIAAVTSRSDQPPTPGRPGDVTGNEEPLLVASISATGQRILVPRQRTYSQTALQYDLSTSIRLDATWPMAINGFKKDPLLGSGYATLNKTSLYDFTDAESTDNDYLRSLGETGLLGTLAFFGTIGGVLWFTMRKLGGIKDSFLYSLTVGYLGLTVGLLANAVLIDVFEASKVAYVFWGVSGIALAAIYVSREKIRENMEPLRLHSDWRIHLNNLFKFLKSDRFWIVVIALAAFMLRTYKLDGPVADWHSWRQADTSGVTRTFVQERKLDWLYPRYEDLSSVPSGLPNPAGYRFVEFPIYNAASALLKLGLPELTVEQAGRLVTDFSFAVGIIFLFLICRQLFSRRIGYLVALTYALIPYNLYYGRTILPDPSMVMLSLGAIYFVICYLQNNKKYNLIASLVFAALSLLVKPFAVFLLLPIAYLWFVNYRFNPKKWGILLIYILLAALPLIIWRLWIRQYPEGIPASDWLLNGNGIRFKGAFWFWLFADRIGRLILGYWGLILLGFGLIRKLESKYKFFPILFLLSSFLYLFVFATGNVQHDYYQILIVPSLAVIAGIGLDTLLFRKSDVFNSYLAKILAIISFLFMLAFGWYFVKDYFNINHPEIVEAGKAVSDLTPEKAKVIAPYDGDTAFLYQTNRRGWPIIDRSLDYMIGNGADYYVSVKFDDPTNSLIAKSVTPELKKLLILKNRIVPPYTLIKKTDRYVIIQLVPDKDLPKA